MNKTIKRLIEITVNVTTQERESKYRDRVFELCWNYNDGDDYWYIAHDGSIWNIDSYLKPSQNQFKEQKKALEELKNILLIIIDEFDIKHLYNEEVLILEKQ